MSITDKIDNYKSGVKRNFKSLARAYVRYYEISGTAISKLTDTCVPLLDLAGVPQSVSRGISALGSAQQSICHAIGEELDNDTPLQDMVANVTETTCEELRKRMQPIKDLIKQVAPNAEQGYAQNAIILSGGAPA